MDIVTIDCDYLFPRFAACYLIHRGGRALLIENNTERCLPKIEAALCSVGLNFHEIDYAIVTHAHLDHAGASGKLMELCPSATFVSHPKAIEHLTEPSKLVAGVKNVYGMERFQKWYGEVHAVPRSRTRAMQDGECLEWQGYHLQFIHTRGHANHHCCIVDAESESIFCGDTFGLRYPALQANGLFIVPTTSPTGYEPDEAIKSVKRIADLGVKSAYLTHFGRLTEMDAAAEQLVADLEFGKQLVNEAARSLTPKEGLKEYCHERLLHYLQRRVDERGIPWENAQTLLSLDIELNAAGVAHAVGYERKRLGV